MDDIAPIRPPRRGAEPRSEGPVRRQQTQSWQETVEYRRYYESLSHSTFDQNNRDLTRKVGLILIKDLETLEIVQTKSWRSAPPSSPTTTADTAKFRFSEIPKIFIYHGSTLKTYFKSWN